MKYTNLHSCIKTKISYKHNYDKYVKINVNLDKIVHINL